MSTDEGGIVHGCVSSLARPREKGSVMLVALFIMVVLSILGAAFLTLTNTESYVAFNAL